MTWYDELDFVENPFTIKPRSDFNEFIGHKNLANNAIKAIEGRKNILIRGRYGTGKTSVLKSLINTHKGKGKVFYYNAFANNKKLDFDNVIKNAGGFFSKAFGLKTKGLIALFDEAHALDEENLLEIEDYHRRGFFKSIILVTSEVDFEFPSSVMKLIDEEHTIPMFSESEAIAVVRNRLVDEHDLLPEDIIKEIYALSNSPRDFLQKCDDVCRNVFMRHAKKAAKKDLKVIEN